MFRELPQGKETSTAHHLIVVRQALAHCLQHWWQHPKTQSTIRPQNNLWILKHKWVQDITRHTWCVCGRHIPQPTRPDTWDHPSSDTGFHWQGRPEQRASDTQTTYDHGAASKLKLYLTKQTVIYQNLHRNRKTMFTMTKHHPTTCWKSFSGGIWRAIVSII